MSAIDDKELVEQIKGMVEQLHHSMRYGGYFTSKAARHRLELIHQELLSYRAIETHLIQADDIVHTFKNRPRPSSLTHSYQKDSKANKE